MRHSALNDIPTELKSLTNFVLYRRYEEDGEIKKRPYDWLGGKRGNNSPELQLSFDSALQKLGTQSDLGLAIFQPDGGISVKHGELNAYLWIVDCDGFIATIDGNTKMLHSGWDLIDKCAGSYAELTVSKRGFKIFVLSDLEPRSKMVFPLAQNEFATVYPEIKKYGTSHAVEVFSCGFWNVITGERIHSDYSELRFIQKQQLLELLEHLKSLNPQKTGEPTEIVSQEAMPRAFPNKFGIITALSKVDNQSEAIWNELAYCLARLVGSVGMDLFIGFSRGDYNGRPYDKYKENEVRERYARALLEVQKKPEGYGLAHLSKLSGLPISAITLETQAVVAPIPGMTAAELATKDFPPLEWVVDGILPEGSYLLSARPKVGKSWLALQICLGVAYGEPVLGRSVKQGRAIYLALEDNHRRLQSRLRQLRPTGYATEDLILHTKWSRFNEGGVESLIKEIEEHEPRIIVIDTFAKVRPPTRNGNLHESDYGALAPITEVANKYRTTILIVHHNRKGRAETDPLEQISGSLGLAGAVDGALIIDGNRGDPSYTLSLIGRDIPNDDDLAISLQKNGQWIVLGAAREVFISQERQAVKELLLLHPGGLKPSELSELTGKKPGAIRKLMNSMARDGQLVNMKGTYSLPTLSSSDGNCIDVGNGGVMGGSGNSGNSSNTSNPTDLDPLEGVTELPQLPVLHG